MLGKVLLSLRIGAPTGNPRRPALLNIISSVHDQIRETQKAQAKLEARLEVVNLRIEQNRRKEEAARRASDQWQHVTQEAWPKSLMHIKKMLPSKDVRLLVRRCRDNPLVHPIFARKKIWVCELCCRKYNKQACAVFQAAETSQLADLQSDIWARIHTLETLSALADAGRGGDGAGGGGVARAGWEADKRKGLSFDAEDSTDVEDSTEDLAATSKGFGSSRLPQLKPHRLRLPMVPGAMRAIGSRTQDTSHDMLPQVIVEFSPEVCYDRPEGDQDLAHAQTRYDEAALPRGGTQWRKRAPLVPTYPVTEIPAPCSPRCYDSLNNFSARMRDFTVMPADGQRRSWWRPAGMAARGWAEAPEIPEGFRLPEIVPLLTVAQDADAARAAYLVEAARLRTLPKTTLSLVDKAQEAIAATAEGVRPAAKGAVLGDGDGVQHGAVYMGGRLKKGGPKGEERIAGLTPRARWFQPKLNVGGGENKVCVGSDGDVPALPLPPRAQERQGSQTHQPATNLPEVLGVRLDMAVDIAEMVRTVKLNLNRSASPTQPRTEVRSPRTARSTRAARSTRTAQVRHSASVQSPSSRLDASLLTPADMRVLKDVQVVLISRFRDCYAAYAALGGSATQDWKLSPSCFYRTLLRLGVEEGLLVTAMHVLAPFCSCGHLSLHDFVSLFSWHSAQSIVGKGHEGKSMNQDVNHDCDAPPLQAHVAKGELPAESMMPSTTMHRRQPAPFENTLTAKRSDTAPGSQLPGASLDTGERANRHSSDRDSSSGQRAFAMRALPSVNTGCSVSVHKEPQQDTATEPVAHDLPTQSAVLEREGWDRSLRTLPSVISWYVNVPLPPKRDAGDEQKGNTEGAQLEMPPHPSQTGTQRQALDPHATLQAPKPSASTKWAVKHHQLHNQQSAMTLAQDQELQELFVSLRSSYPQGQKPRPGRPLRAAYQISQVPAIDFKWGEESGNRAKDKAKSRNLKVEHAYGTPMLPRAPAKAKVGPKAEAGGNLKTTLTPPVLQTAASACESVEVSAAKVDPAPDHVMMTATDLSADETDTCHTVGHEDDFDH